MGVEIHFLNVGEGDCTIIHFPSRKRKKDGKEKYERIMMVDICHNEDHEEYEDIVEYYKSNFANDDGTYKPIFRFVCTHPHQDHICGLAKLFNDSGIKIYNFWDLDHCFEPDDFNGHPTHEDDWDAYLKLRGDNSPATVLKLTRETKMGLYWSDDEDRITILSPSKELIKSAHHKDDGTKRDTVEIDEMSYALMIKVNDRKVILAGDGRKSPVWNDIYDNCLKEITDCAVLKAGHHGQEASFHEEALKAMNPSVIVFSNSESKDDDNGAGDLYAEICPDALILKTCDHGTIRLDVPWNNDEQIKYSVSK